jgi:hypothetical protein
MRLECFFLLLTLAFGLFAPRDAHAQPPSLYGRAVRVAYTLGRADGAPGAAPDGTHPSGTLFLAWGDETLGPVLVEWDVATERVLRRLVVGVSKAHNDVQIFRAGNVIYMVAGGGPTDAIELVAVDATSLAKTWGMSLDPGLYPSVSADAATVVVTFSVSPRFHVRVVDAGTHAVVGRQSFEGTGPEPYRPVLIGGTIVVGFPRAAGPIVHALRRDGAQTAVFDPRDGAWGTNYGQVAEYGGHVFLQSGTSIYELSSSLVLLKTHPNKWYGGRLAIEPRSGLVVGQGREYASRLGAQISPVRTTLSEEARPMGVFWANGRAVGLASRTFDVYVWTFDPTPSRQP